MDREVRKSFSPTLCVTHNCNLSCVYCYQNHDNENRMSFDVAKKCVDWIFNNIPNEKKGVNLEFIGGEPLIEYDLLKEIYNYTENKKSDLPVKYFASTNGTLLNPEMKKWFAERKDKFILGLSLDGSRETHNFNRSNSYDLIDIDFFRLNWPDQAIKMTLSDYSINHLANDVISVHNLGFKYINGVNLCEGNFNWSKPEYLKAIAEQLRLLVDFYEVNSNLIVNQMFRRHIETCETHAHNRNKRCGIGSDIVFFDTNGEKYPCVFMTPMTFTNEELKIINKIDFYNNEYFIDEECCRNCYIYPICTTCAASNYMLNGSFKIRNKSRCEITKLICLYIAELEMRKILNNSIKCNETDLYYKIEAIKNIKNKYLNEYKNIMV